MPPRDHCRGAAAEARTGHSTAHAHAADGGRPAGDGAPRVVREPAPALADCRCSASCSRSCRLRRCGSASCCSTKSPARSLADFRVPQTRIAALATLLALQVGIAIVASLVQTVYGAARELLGDTLQNRISLRILHKAAALDVESFENAETYDALRNAYNEVGSRPLGVMFQVIGIGQALITLASIGSLMARLGWEVLPLVLLASIPGVLVSSRFGAESYRVMRRRATDARHQNYLGSILTSDSLVKEVRLFGFERYLLDGWQDYYKKFRAQFVSLLARRSAWGLAATLGSSLLIALATLSVLRRAAQRHHHRRRLFALRRRHRADSESVHRTAQRRHGHLREPALHAQPVRVSRAAVAQSRRRRRRGADRSTRSSSSASASAIR